MKIISKGGALALLLSLLLLIGNDWFGKAMFANALTGKLSDFAGLFAFPFIFSLLLPRHVKAVHCASALFFLLWKSEAVQPLLDALNNWGLPVGRTVDYSDYVALLSVPVSYWFLAQAPSLRLSQRQFAAMVCVSSAAFMATSMILYPRKYIGINKEYRFAFSQRELVRRLNFLQIKYVSDIDRFGNVEFDSLRNLFYYRPSGDTLAVMLDYRRVRPNDTLRLRNYFAEIQISGDSSASVLKLVSVRYLLNRREQKNEVAKEANYKADAVRKFEKSVVNKIKEMH
jgi:hypothetical protein